MNKLLKSKYINSEINLALENATSPTTVTVRQFIQKVSKSDQPKYMKQHQISDYNKHI